MVDGCIDIIKNLLLKCILLVTRLEIFVEFPMCTYVYPYTSKINIKYNFQFYSYNIDFIETTKEEITVHLVNNYITYNSVEVVLVNNRTSRMDRPFFIAARKTNNLWGRKKSVFGCIATS